uniref:G_PROTEIN_RECEP_F1_2 domain-containing protein n=1 Tax=Rhabditophanes sp. KR3021 TaxID=114890 RepID=A0AC35TY11_9BILA
MLLYLMLVASIIGIFLATSLLIMLPHAVIFISHKTSWNLYFKGNIVIVMISIFIQTSLTFVIDVVILLANEIPTYSTEATIFKLIYDEVRIAQTAFNSVIRLGVWILVLERVYSTKYRKTYEQRKNTLVSILCVYLWFHNRTLRIQEKGKLLKLSEKFQISLNITSIKLAIPLVVGFAMLNFVFNVILDFVPNQIFDRQIVLVWNYTSLAASHLFFVLLVCYELNNFQGKSYIFLKVWSLMRRKSYTVVDVLPSTDIRLKDLKIINSFGKVVTTNADQTSYFTIFNASWK